MAADKEGLIERHMNAVEFIERLFFQGHYREEFGFCVLFIL
jgi:hypothetical protein